MIKVENLTVSFGRKKVIDKMSFTVEEGSAVAIIGPTGCGKTILLKTILGLIKPEKGNIYLKGKDIFKISHIELNFLLSKVGVLFQNNALFDSLTVWENIGFYLLEHTDLNKEEVRRKVAEKLSLVDLSGTEDLKPEELSGGMRKKVALARALIGEPDVIFYDEPTANLDPLSSWTIGNLINDLQRKFSITTIMVTHDRQLALRFAERLFMLHNGRLIGGVSPEETKKTDNPVIRHFLEI